MLSRCHDSERRDKLKRLLSHFSEKIDRNTLTTNIKYDSLLVHVWNRRALAATMKAANRTPGRVEPSLQSQEQHLDLLTGLNNLIDPQLLFKKGSKLCYSFHWSAPISDTTKIRSHDEVLPCILGLPGYYQKQHYYVAYFSPSTADTFLKPTAFHSSLFEQWRPGGRTKPYVDCQADHPAGLEEVLHHLIEPAKIKWKIKKI